MSTPHLFVPEPSTCGCPSPQMLRLRRQDQVHAHAAVQSTVARVFQVAAADLDAANRCRAPIAFARQVAMYLTHVAFGFSLTTVGGLFSRDRTTVAHACQTIEDRRDNDRLDRCLDVLESIVRSEARCRSIAAAAAPEERP